MKVAKQESMPNVVAGSMVLASLICMLPAVTIAPEMGLPNLFQWLQYYNLTAFGEGVEKWQLSQLESFTGKAVVQVTEYSYTNIQAADSLTFMHTSQI